MDPNAASSVVNDQQPASQQQSGLSGIQAMIRDKKFLLIGSGFIGILFLGILLIPGRTQNDTAPEVLVTEVPTVAVEVPTPTKTVEYKQAVQEAATSTLEYEAGRTAVKEEFPWIRKFPVSGEGKYFVYFDKEKRVFVGKLYPQSGDNVEQLKVKAKQHMQQREIPPDAYPFEWRVTSPAAR